MKVFAAAVLLALVVSCSARNSRRSYVTDSSRRTQMDNPCPNGLIYFKDEHTLCFCATLLFQTEDVCVSWYIGKSGGSKRRRLMRYGTRRMG